MGFRDGDRIWPVKIVSRLTEEANLLRQAHFIRIDSTNVHHVAYHARHRARFLRPSQQWKASALRQSGIRPPHDRQSYSPCRAFHKIR